MCRSNGHCGLFDIVIFYTLGWPYRAHQVYRTSTSLFYGLARIISAAGISLRRTSMCITKVFRGTSGHELMFGSTLKPISGIRSSLMYYHKACNEFR